MGKEINLSVSGTYIREGDIIIFSGDGVKTIANIKGGCLIIEGNKYCRV